MCHMPARFKKENKQKKPQTTHQHSNIDFKEGFTNSRLRFRWQCRTLGSVIITHIHMNEVAWLYDSTASNSSFWELLGSLSFPGSHWDLCMFKSSRYPPHCDIILNQNTSLFCMTSDTRFQLLGLEQNNTHKIVPAIAPFYVLKASYFSSLTQSIKITLNSLTCY